MKDISDKNKNVIDAYCCLIGLLRKQDGVSWHAPIYDAKVAEQNGIEFDVGRKITLSEYHKLANYLDAEIEKVDFEYNVNGAKKREHFKSAVSGKKEKPTDPDIDPKLGLVSTKSGVRIIDFENNFADKRELQKKMHGILKRCDLFDKKTVVGMKSTGNYLTGEWTLEGASGNGHGYFDKLKKMFPDKAIQDKIRALYDKYKSNVDAVEEKTARGLGYEGPMTKAPDWEV